MKQRFRALTFVFISLVLLARDLHPQEPLEPDRVLAAFPANVQAEYRPQPVCDDSGDCGLFWASNHLYPDSNTVDIVGILISPQGQGSTPARILATGHFTNGPVVAGLEHGFAVLWENQFPDGHISPVLQYLDPTLNQEGEAINLPFSESAAITSPNAYNGFASIARTSSGFLLYGSTNDTYPALAYDAFIYFIRPDGSVDRPRVKVNEGSGTNSNVNFLGIAIQPSGSLITVYWRGSADVSDIYMRRLSATGKPLGPETLVNIDRHRSQGQPVVATALDGSFVVAWQCAPGNNAPNDILARRFSAKGKPLGPPFQVNNVHSLDQRFPVIAADTRGNYFIAWQSFSPRFDWDIKGRWFRPDGTPFFGEVRLNQVRQFEQERPIVTVSPAGTAIVGWESAANRQRGGEALVPVARVFAPAP